MVINAGKKSVTGRPRIDSKEVSARIAQPLLGQLNAWITAHHDNLTRPEAIRVLLQDALTAKGHTTLTEAHANLTHEIQALEHDLANIPAGT